VPPPKQEAKKKREAARRARAGETHPQLMKMLMDEEGAAADVWITALEEVAAQPEAEFIKEEIEQVANTLKGAKEVLKKLKEWEEKASDPESNTPEGSKKRLEEHADILAEVAAAFGGDKDGDKKDDKKKDKKKDDKKGKDGKDGASDKFGPQYDPEDYMGGAEAGNRLQEAVKMSRDATMAMRLRQDEVRRFTELCSGSEAGSYLRLIDSCITQLRGGLVFEAHRRLYHSGAASAGAGRARRGEQAGMHPPPSTLNPQP